MMAYSCFVEFLQFKLEGKSGTSKFSTNTALFYQRGAALKRVKESCKEKALKERAKTQTQMKTQAKTVLQPDLSKNIENCVSNWHLSKKYKKRIEAFTETHGNCVKAKKKPTKTEYEDAVAIVGTEISICNGARKSSVSAITNLEYYQKEKRYNVSASYETFLPF